MMQPLPEAVLPTFLPSHRFSSLQKGLNLPGPLFCDRTANHNMRGFVQMSHRKHIQHQITDALPPLIPGLVVVMVIAPRSPAMEEVRSEGA